MALLLPPTFRSFLISFSFFLIRDFTALTFLVLVFPFELTFLLKCSVSLFSFVKRWIAMELKERRDRLDDWFLTIILPLQTDESGDKLRVVTVDILETFVDQSLQTCISRLPG